MLCSALPSLLPLTHSLSYLTLPSPQQYQTTVRALAEDPSEKGPDDFFGTVEQFLARMAEARADLAAMKRREEEDRKKKELAAAAAATQAEKNVRLEEVCVCGGGGGSFCMVPTILLSSLVTVKLTLQNTHTHSLSLISQPQKKKGGQQAGPELDDLISTLRSGECFGTETETRRGRKGAKQHKGVRGRGRGG